MDILDRIREADEAFKLAQTVEYEKAKRKAGEYIQALLDHRNALIVEAVDGQGIAVRQVAIKGLNRQNPTSAKRALEAGRRL